MLFGDLPNLASSGRSVGKRDLDLQYLECDLRELT